MMDPLSKLAPDSATESDDHDDDFSENEGNEDDLDSINKPLLNPSDTQGKKKKPGIIFLSSVPMGMNVTQTISFFSQFGKVGRVFLQPDKTDKKSGKYNRVFSEGWVEFLSKKVAKAVAEKLNNTPVGGKRRSKSHDQLWNLKYLSRFKWVHLSERLAYENAVRQQRLRTEISQVKREAEHFKSSVERKRKRAKRDKERDSTEESFANSKPTSTPFRFTQKETESQIKKRKLVKEDGDGQSSESSKPKKSKKTKVKESTDTSAGPSRNKSAKKSKTKKSKTLKKETSSLRHVSGEGDRSAFLKSVFGAGGSS